MGPGSENPTSATTELAKERNRAATERTLTSWIQNSLALIAFGLAFDRIISALIHAPASDGRAASFVSLGAIGLGVFLLLLAIAVHRNEQLSFRLSVLSAGAVILFGLVALVSLLLKIS
ncbi:MAG TPA: DUF202 domain-containing protein [Candidatus Baltobacteraceae bacterium]|nr:DUF202 domain-containing protein [Candidatus Baltobacteraceae bacterium]